MILGNRFLQWYCRIIMYPIRWTQQQKGLLEVLIVAREIIGLLGLE